MKCDKTKDNQEQKTSLKDIALSGVELQKVRKEMITKCGGRTKKSLKLSQDVRFVIWRFENLQTKEEFGIYHFVITILRKICKICSQILI